ncbi:MAG: polymer-forming cytoskeletal protein [Pseudomonadota bacterium]
MADRPCIIGKQIIINGKVSGDEELIIEGRIEGEIVLSSHLTVQPSAVVEANIQVPDLTLSGTVRGDIRASQSVTIKTDANVVGNISSPRVIIEDGAKFAGQIEMDVKLPSDLTKR